jgi:hypothetical protein
MKYVCLVYFDERELNALPKKEIDALHAEAEAYVTEMRRREGFLAADALEPTDSAVTLRKRRGAVSVSDGPFAETKEQLGEVVLIDAPNLDEAIKVAARVPSARFGSVEIRPVRVSAAPR